MLTGNKRQWGGRAKTLVLLPRSSEKVQGGELNLGGGHKGGRGGNNRSSEAQVGSSERSPGQKGHLKKVKKHSSPVGNKGGACQIPWRAGDKKRRQGTRLMRGKT